MRLLFSLAAALSMMMAIASCGNTGGSAKLKAQDFQQSQAKPPTVAPATRPAPSPVNVPPPNDTPPQPPAGPRNAGLPATRPLSSGTFLIVGTLVAEANGQPIYADKVLSKIDEALGIKAQTLGPREYRLAAIDLINRQIMEDITNELEFAAAQRNVSEEDRQIATGLTVQFRQKEITRAGGSLAVARARTAAEGIDFDEKVNEEYRRNLIRIYYAKRVFPKVQVSAEDMRRFYDKYLDELYTEKSAVRFRGIRIGIQETGSVQDAWEKAKRVHDKATRGENFGDLAAAQNDNRTWARYRGYRDVRKDAAGQPLKDETGEFLGAWVDKGSLKLEDLEKAVFTLNIGQVTTIIDAGEGLYIAKLEEKKVGRVRAFEEEAVQADVRDRMTKEQRAELRRKEQKKLLDAAVTRTDQKMVDVAVEMAMQKYAIWGKGE